VGWTDILGKVSTVGTDTVHAINVNNIKVDSYSGCTADSWLAGRGITDLGG
jgi:hypothetical protein